MYERRTDHAAPRPDPVSQMNAELAKLQINVGLVRDSVARLQVAYAQLDTAQRQLNAAVASLQHAVQQGDKDA